MNILLIFPGFILAFIIVFCYEYKIRQFRAESRNRVHFYVARDKNEKLWLYMSEPIRGDNGFVSALNIDLTHRNFHIFGLNKNDFDNLKWEDKPVEVFLNMEY